jgi:Rrf2 family protein
MEILMRISVKGRYALFACTCLAENYESGEHLTVISISEKLGVSKIYLEQVFSLLKRSGLVTSVKGAQGGYMLSRSPQQISAYDVLSAVETALFEPTADTVTQKTPETEAAVRELVFDKLDSAVKSTLEQTSLYDLTSEIERKKNGNFMFFI